MFQLLRLFEHRMAKPVRETLRNVIMCRVEKPHVPCNAEADPFVMPVLVFSLPYLASADYVIFWGVSRICWFLFLGL